MIRSRNDLKTVVLCTVALCLMLVGCTPAESTSLISPPRILLGDSLSSDATPVNVIEPSPYKWIYYTDNKKSTDKKEGDSDCAVIAIPHYNKLTSYMYHLIVFEDENVLYKPDKITIKDLSTGTVTNCTVYENGASLLTLERGKEYVITLQWNKSNYRRRGFWGEASYRFRTE